MFDSIFSKELSMGVLVLITVAVTALVGIISSLIVTFKIKTSKGFFVTIALIPTLVAITFVFLNVMLINDTTAAITGIAAVMVGLGLIRFRSAQGKAEEMLMLFASVATGAIAGLGYLAYSSIFEIAFSLIVAGLMSTNILSNRKMSTEKLLKITIPENLEYNTIFDETFKHYLKEYEMVGVKTTGMGSMFRLSYRIIMKDPKEEKELIDDLRIRNGNLEISILPYVEDTKSL